MKAGLKIFLAVFLAVAALGPITCGKRSQGDGKGSATTSGITKAVTVLKPTQGNVAQGTVTFTQAGDGIRIVVDLDGLTPGRHGFHIHEKGDCSAPDAMSAGGHFNPENKQHGAPNSEDSHVGDLGNIEVGEDCVAHYESINKMISFSGPHSIIGKALVIHENEDDEKSQPSGNSGGRLACGVIEAARP